MAREPTREEVIASWPTTPLQACNLPLLPKNLEFLIPPEISGMALPTGALVYFTGADGTRNIVVMRGNKLYRQMQTKPK